MKTIDENAREPTGRDEESVEAMLDELFKGTQRLRDIPDMEFKSLLLADYDALQQRRRKRLSLALFAEALGWRALSRPIAAAGLLAGLSISGFIAGAAAAPGESATFAELSVALDRSFDYSEESVPWAEE